MSIKRMPITIALVLGLLSFGMTGCANSDMERYRMQRDSQYNYGVMRTVTAYSSTGEQIGQWHGKIDVQYVPTEGSGSSLERVDVVIFDGETPIDRIIISGAIVIVDND